MFFPKNGEFEQVFVPNTITVEDELPKFLWYLPVAAAVLGLVLALWQAFG
jgi:hypothetical protein